MSDVPVFVVLGGTGGIGSESTDLPRSVGYEVLIVAPDEAQLEAPSNETGAKDGGLGSARTMPHG